MARDARAIFDGESSYPSPELVTLLASGLLDGKRRALEVGCGIASDSLLLAASGFRVDAVDRDRRQLEAARRRATTVGARVAFSLAEATDLPYRDRSFDLVIDRLLWNNVLSDGDGAAYVQELARVTRPGALMLVRAKSPGWHTVAESFGASSPRDFGGAAVWREIGGTFRLRSEPRRLMLVAPGGPLVPASVAVFERLAGRARRGP